mmetsp:Transcript_41649/g.66860  ORF Transcript_41649/g.66860 Transcript_41649/m.66860 type:complete len:252 (+) Transcript_41649:58-813(+)
MGDIADDINEVFSLQSSIFKAIEMLQERTDADTLSDVVIPPWVIQQAEGLVFMWTYKVGMFLSFSAGNGVVLRKKRGPGGEAQWSLPCAISFGGAGFGLDFGAACSSSVCVLNSQEMVAHFGGQHVKLALDAQACAGPVGRSVEGMLNVTADDAANLDAAPCYTYGTSEGLFAGAGMHATWVTVRDASNEDYYRRQLSGPAILGCFGHEAGEMGRRHEEIFRLHAALDKAGGAQRAKLSRNNTAEMRGTPF